MKSLLSYFGYELKQSGTGSGIKFIKSGSNEVINFHRPHPNGALKSYILDRVIEKFKKEWFIMSNLLSYKNYNGTVEYSREDDCLFGKVVGIKSLLSYEGDSVKELEQDFQNVIDEYLEDCKNRKVEPDKEYRLRRQRS